MVTMIMRTRLNVSGRLPHTFVA